MAMIDAQLRARVRELIASGELPSEPPVIQSSGDGGWRPATARRTSPGETCTICGEPDPTVAYFWTGGRVAPLHAACDALWKLERGSRVELRARIRKLMALGAPPSDSEPHRPGQDKTRLLSSSR